MLLIGFARADESATPATQPAGNPASDLVNAISPSSAYLFDSSARSQLDSLGRELHETKSPVEQTDAEKKLHHLVEASQQFVDVTFDEGRAVTRRDTPIPLPGDAGAVLLRVSDGAGDMRVRRIQYDLLKTRDPISLDTAKGTTWAVIQLAGVPAGVSSLVLEFKRGGRKPTPFILNVQAPPLAQFKFKAVSADTGEPLPVMLEMVWKLDGKGRQPTNAVDLSSQFEFIGRIPGPRPAKLPGRLADHVWWCVPGPFDMPIPPGEWQMIIRHGLEYLPIFDTFTARPGEDIEQTYRLRRWVNMPKRGWYSGDDHVHCQILSDADAKRLLTWARAEDTHVVNVLKMSDVYRTWFEQRGFGPGFRVRDGDYVLVPGQECPRTHSDGFGHTISLNTKSYVRNVAEYWLYDRVADTVHEQGGLFGFAHTYLLHPYIRRGMSLIATRPRVDMAEIMQVAQMGTDFYYDWLNLGYKLAATAGSDVPFQGTIGEVRMYAYIGGKKGAGLFCRNGPEGASHKRVLTPFSADAWFEAVKRGRTFVTNGPMLELRVDDAMPGDEITLKESRPLHVRARAWGDPELMTPVRLEIIRHGEIIKSVEASPAKEKEISLEFDVPAGDGFWLAARAAGSDGSLAHTTPDYVVREPLRFWKYDAVPKLIDQRLANLADVEDLVARARELQAGGKTDDNLTAQTMAQQGDELLKRVKEARAFYNDLRQVAERERPLRSSAATKPID